MLGTLSGCPDPNIYGTPRTLAPGDIQFQAAIDGYGGTASGTTGATPGLPSFGARFGLADRLDVGARLIDMTAVGGDAKYNFVRGRFDMAVDPIVQAYFVLPPQTTTSAANVGVLQFQLPLLLGINFDDATTLVFSPGFVASVATRSPQGIGLNTEQVAFASSGLGARLGIGLNIRTSDTFSWQPEVTAWHEFNGVDSWVCVAGIGINIGAQPDYSDLAPR